MTLNASARCPHCQRLNEQGSGTRLCRHYVFFTSADADGRIHHPGYDYVVQRFSIDLQSGPEGEDADVVKRLLKKHFSFRGRAAFATSDLVKRAADAEILDFLAARGYPVSGRAG